MFFLRMLFWLNFIIYLKEINFILIWFLRFDLVYLCGWFGKGLNLFGNKVSLIMGLNNRLYEMENWICDKDGCFCIVCGVRIY